MVFPFRYHRSGNFCRRGARVSRHAERLGRALPTVLPAPPKNLNRKSGNIEEFVTRWGGRYAHMVVLDADSLMTGRTIIALAAAMEADPDAGIIQTLPLIVNRNTLFARLQQFAARIYGPVIAAGFAICMGATAITGAITRSFVPGLSPPIAVCRFCAGGLRSVGIFSAMILSRPR